MDTLMKINGVVNNFIWGPVMLVLLVGTGIYLTLRLKGFTIRKLGYVFKNTIMKLFDKDKKETGEGEISAFQALATALAATVGTGNIAGVATAIVMGGPGAVFWMWISAFFGMATKFAEVVLSIEYRETTEDGRYVGGPMYYIKNGLHNDWLAKLFAALAALASFGIGNLVQSNSMAESLQTSFNINPKITGIVVAILVGIVILGGLKRIANITEKLVPTMSVFYILGGVLVIAGNYRAIPEAFSLIFRYAFTPMAARGALIGSTVRMGMRYGVARGVFSNEAGLGSAPIAHAAATTDHPVRQGLWGIFEVFVDTIMICTITALTILVSGVWDSGLSGAALTTMAFENGLPGPGGYIVSIGIMLFAFSTCLSWSYYGERALEFLFGSGAIKIYRIVWIPMVYVGATVSLDVVWGIADTLNGLMAIPNLIAIIWLSPVVIKLTREFLVREGIWFESVQPDVAEEILEDEDRKKSKFLG